MKTAIGTELQYVREATSSDFSALALTDEPGSRIRWSHASGNLNDRYRHMRLKPGTGIAGLAIRLGRPAVLDRTSSERLRQECPVMLAERLASAVAVPFAVPPERTGVLLIGSRQERTYTAEEISMVTEGSKRIGRLFQESH